MKIRVVTVGVGASIAPGLLVVTMAVGSVGAQMSASNASATVAACGVMTQNFSVKGETAVVSAVQPNAGRMPAGKAMVHVVEDIVQIPMNTPTLRIGMDGKWIGATRSHTYLSFAVDPGVHHLCVSVQGLAAYQLESGITLHQLDAKVGETYYFRLREILSQSPPLLFVDTVDTDEGQLLLQTAVPAVWKAK